VFNNFFPENRAVYEIMCKNIAELRRPQMTIWRMRISWWKTKATHTHTHTLTICNIHCIPTATMVIKTLFYVTLYAYCLSCCMYRILHKENVHRQTRGRSYVWQRRKSYAKELNAKMSECHSPLMNSHLWAGETAQRNNRTISIYAINNSGRAATYY